eukprot:6199818-Pleurochrysis_carterae.AAC.2
MAERDAHCAKQRGSGNAAVPISAAPRPSRVSRKASLLSRRSIRTSASKSNPPGSFIFSTIIHVIDLPDYARNCA